MAPIMILLLGVAPVTAVGTDLWFAGITKSIGGLIHHAGGNADLRVAKWLWLGSIPFAVVTLALLNAEGSRQLSSGFVTQALGAVLVVTALATFFRQSLQGQGERLRVRSRKAFKRLQIPLTVIAGAILGVLVTLTSVGAGALCATVLVFLYPVRLKLKKVVGTDIVHAVPLTLVAGVGHLWMGNVDGRLLVSLLSGSIPGIIVSSLLVHNVNERTIRVALAAVLMIVGGRLAIG